MVAFALSCTELAGPTGLAPLEPWQFAIKMVLGVIIGFALIAPLTLNPGRSHRFLDSAPMQALGRWSYSIFLWHLVVLAWVFPLAGIVPFSGSMLVVFTLTLLLTIGVSAASYAWIEEPTRHWLRNSEARAAAPSVAPETGRRNRTSRTSHRGTSIASHASEYDRQQSR